MYALFRTVSCATLVYIGAMTAVAMIITLRWALECTALSEYAQIRSHDRKFQKSCPTLSTDLMAFPKHAADKFNANYADSTYLSRA